MGQVIIYKNPEANNVIVCTPSGIIPIEEVLARDCPPGAIIVDEETLPDQHNDFFNAWEMTIENNTHSISINTDTARHITKHRLRVEREPLLAAQDILFQRALESNSDTSAIVAEKQRLRDITNLTDNVSTLEELRNLTCQ